MTADPLAPTLPARDIAEDAGRPWLPLDRRQAELGLTVATLVLIVLSALAGRLGLSPLAHRFVDGAAYVTGGWFAVGGTVPRLLRGEFDVDFLMLLAAAGAALTGNWHEGAILLFLFSLSNTLQTYAMARSRHAISRLLQRRPRHATVLRNGAEALVPIESLAVGDLMLVRPGEMVPTDGVVRQGLTEMNEASITGESTPAEKGPGALAYAGAMNGTGAVEIEVTRLAEDSTLARIVKMVEAAETHKARSQRFLERAESVYAWTILSIVILLVIVPWLGRGRAFDLSLYRAMVFLVVASPCALVISTPAAILSAIANGARHGILFKGGAYLESMAEVRVVVLDKTGTLTTGRPGVTDVILGPSAPPGFTEDVLLAHAAVLESRSEHPLAREIVRAAEGRGLDLPPMTDFVALPGRGVHATIDGYKVWIGGDRLYREHGEQIAPALAAVQARLEREGKSALILHRELERRGSVGTHESTGGWLGVIGMADTMREDVPDTIRRFKSLGITRTVMLTGDNETVARNVAERAGIDEFHASLLPEEKVRLLREIRATHGPVMMIGDGVNDAPALANASVGVAMGAAGTDLALESAHCVLMGDDLGKVAYALALSRRAVRTVVANLAFSAAVILVLITGLFTVGIPLPLGVVGHEGSTLIVCANGLRLLQTPRRWKEEWRVKNAK
jgi:Zn2+/Cd2+-exporting ATPase